MNQFDQPVDFITQIHSVLAVRYGAGWARMWQGLDMNFVRADWRRVLREFEANPAAVAYALDSLPVGQRPPNAGEFLQLCQAAPRPAVRMLARSGAKPTADQLAVLRSVRERLQSAVGRGSFGGNASAGWERILERMQAGEPVTPTIRRMALEQANRVGGLRGGDGR